MMPESDKPLLSHKRGDSMQPAESTTTLAVSVVRSPVIVLRQVTLLACPAASVWIRRAKAFGTRVIALPCRAQRSAVKAIGMELLSIERLAFRLRGARSGRLQP